MPSFHEDLERIVDECGETYLAPEERASIVRAVGEYITAQFVSIDETSRLIVQSRLQELGLMQAVVGDVIDAMTAGDTQEAVERMVIYIGERRTQIKTMAARKPEQD